MVTVISEPIALRVTTSPPLICLRDRKREKQKLRNEGKRIYDLYRKARTLEVKHKTLLCTFITSLITRVPSLELLQASPRESSVSPPYDSVLPCTAGLQHTQTHRPDYLQSNYAKTVLTSCWHGAYSRDMNILTQINTDKSSLKKLREGKTKTQGTTYMIRGMSLTATVPSCPTVSPSSSLLSVSSLEDE